MKLKPKAAIAFLAAGIGGCSAFAVTPVYQLLDLQTLGGTKSEAHGINNAGQVVGWSRTAAGGSFGGANRAFLTQPNSAINPNTDVIPLVTNGTANYGYGVNGNGQATGDNTVSGGDRAFRYSGASSASLGTLGGSWSYAYAINSLGHVVGTAARPKQGNNFPTHAFLHNGTSMFDLGTLGGQDSYAFAINSSGKVAGYAQQSGGAALERAFLWTPSTPNGTSGSIVDLGTLGGSTSYAFGINDAGDVVGGAQTSLDLAYHAFLRPASGGPMVSLGTLGGFSEARDINATGVVVGISANASGNRAFVYLSGMIHDLNNLVSNIAGWTLTSARAVNDSGQIVGYGTSPSGEIHGYLLTPLPTWQVNANGNWSTPGNWLGSVPNSTSAQANFTDAITTARTVTVDIPVSVNQINLNNANSYTLAGTQTISLTGAAASGISVVAGNHDVQAPLALNGSISFSAAAGATLNISGQISSSTSVAIQKSGAGVLQITRIHAGTFTAAEGTTRVTSGGSTGKVSALNVSPGATLDLSDSVMVIDYDIVSPLAQIQSLILAGYNGGAWNGTGITSSTAASAPGELALAYAEASNLGISSFAGENFTGDAVIVALTLAGDTNLDRHVDTMDFNQLAGAFGGSGDWVAGDANYDLVIDSLDFTQMVGNFGKSLAPFPAANPSVAPVPEPQGLLILALAAFARRTSTSR